MNGDLRVGTWLVQPGLNTISQNRISRRLEPKVMEVLLCLAHHPGETLPKEQLLKTVWPDTFVSDDVLVRSISEIRRAFEDDTREPKFIQTIPKRGYRLVVPVERINGIASVSAETALIAPYDSSGLRCEIQEVKAEEVPLTWPAARNAEPAHWPYVVFGLLVITVLMLLVALRPKPLAQLVSVPFTLLRGMEISPSFSPDGKQIAFLWNGGVGGSYDLYTKEVGGESLRRLTSTGDVHSRAAWSPDGKSIAFLRLSGNVVSLAVLPSVGGPEEILLSRAFPAAESSTAWLDDLEWSPQGNALLLVWRPTLGQPSAIFRFSLRDRSLVRLTNPPVSTLGDSAPRYAPDGQTIEFLRLNGYNTADLYVMKTGSENLHRIDFDQRLGAPGTGSWEPDGRHFLVSVAGGNAFLRIPLEGGTPQHLPGFGQVSQLGAVSPDGHLLTFASCWVNSNLWMAKLNFGRKSIETVPFYTSAIAESPTFSPDGTQIAFASKASGEWEIWKCDRNCSRPVQLTPRHSRATTSPAWSPDGGQIVFESDAGKFHGIYVMNADGTGIRLLQGGDFDNAMPRFSGDGRWIYFSSNRTGSWEVWKMSASDGAVTRITRHGGYQAVESSDKRFVLFAKMDAPGLWSLPVGGGEEQLLTDRLRKGYWSHWTIADDSVYFIDADAKPEPNVVRLNLFTHQSREIGVPEGIREWSWGLAVSPDGGSLVGTGISDQHCNIMLGKNYSEATRQ
jgi:Tol biopolymer transport system component/DNA-binding winged helix-turn-helix (wHTH) protein